MQLGLEPKTSIAQTLSWARQLARPQTPADLPRNLFNKQINPQKPPARLKLKALEPENLVNPKTKMFKRTKSLIREAQKEMSTTQEEKLKNLLKDRREKSQEGIRNSKMQKSNTEECNTSASKRPHTNHKAKFESSYKSLLKEMEILSQNQPEREKLSIKEWQQLVRKTEFVLEGIELQQYGEKYDKINLLNILLKVTRKKDTAVRIRLLLACMRCIQKEATISTTFQTLMKTIFKLSQSPQLDESFAKEGIIPKLFDFCILLKTQPRMPLNELTYLFGAIKNLSRQQFKHFKIFLHIMLEMLQISGESHLQSEEKAWMIVQITGSLVNLLDDNSNWSEIVANIDVFFQIMNRFSFNKECLYNILRMWSKLSPYEENSQLLKEPKYLNQLMQTMGENSQDEEILDHITFILANITTFCEDARILLSENLELIENCTSLVDLYQQQSSVSAKLIRLIANLATIQNVSEGLINNVAFIEVLMEFLQSSDNCELQVNSISCLTNILFYDNGSNIQSELRQKLCLCITPFMLHVQELDICIEAVRGICNLSRYQQTLPIFEKLHTVDGLLCLLQAENQVLIYFCVGALINLSSLVKNSSAMTLCYKTIIKVLEFLEEGDFIPQIVQQACRLLLNIGIEEMSEGYKNRIRELLLIIPDAPEELQILLDQLPVTHLCPHEGCGRRFKDQETLENHLSRRHNQLCIL